MSTTITLPKQTMSEKRCAELAEGSYLYINGYNMQRIVYELIKNYMLSNTPKEAGVILAKSYDVDPTKSGIFLDVGYNWKGNVMDKFPAVYVQRGDVEIKSPTMGQAMAYDVKESDDERMMMNTMPVIVTCIAAAPLAVVENLAEYVKQPLICFKKEVKLDFRLREFKLVKITKPVLTPESKNNFFIDLIVETAFDENWVVQRDDLKIKTIGLELFDGVVKANACQSCG